MLLRPWKYTDLQDFNEYASVDGVGQMAGWLPHKNMDESKAILKMFIEEKKTFAIEHDGKVIGSLGIEEQGMIEENNHDKIYGFRRTSFYIGRHYVSMLKLMKIMCH